MWTFYTNIYILKLYYRTTCPHQLPTQSDPTVSLAKAVQPFLVPPGAFATEQGVKTGVKGICFQMLMASL